MRPEDEQQDLSEDVEEFVSNAFDDTTFSQEQSAELYEWLAGFCTTRANLIRQEME
jgi:hypothetical protein